MQDDLWHTPSGSQALAIRLGVRTIDRRVSIMGDEDSDDDEQLLAACQVLERGDVPSALSRRPSVVPFGTEPKRTRQFPPVPTPWIDPQCVCRTEPACSSAIPGHGATPVESRRAADVLPVSTSQRSVANSTCLPSTCPIAESLAAEHFRSDSSVVSFGSMRGPADLSLVPCAPSSFHQRRIAEQFTDEEIAAIRTQKETDWCQWMLGRVSPEKAQIFRQCPQPLLMNLLGPWRIGLKSLKNDDLEAWLDMFIERWPALQCAIATSAARNKNEHTLLPIHVVHISGGHGTGIACCDEACRLLRNHFTADGLHPALHSVQHFVDREPDPSRKLFSSFWQANGAQPLVHTSTWQGSREEALAAANKAIEEQSKTRLLTVVVVVDLGSFQVDSVVASKFCGTWAERCRRLKQWIGTFARTVTLEHLVSVIVDSRYHDDATVSFLGENFGSVYRYDCGSETTGVGRPITVCASPCAARGIWGATVEDMSSGLQRTFVVQTWTEAKRRDFVQSPHADNRRWTPSPGTNAADRDAPSLLTGEWPDILRTMLDLTEAPDVRVQFLLATHRVQAVDQPDDIRYAGPAHFLHFLGWGDSTFTQILDACPCLGRITVATGLPAPDIPPTQDTSVNLVWAAQCGKVVLCHNCSGSVSEIGTAFEKHSVSDVIARHLAAHIRCLFLRQAEADGTPSSQLLQDDLQLPMNMDLTKSLAAAR